MPLMQRSAVRATMAGARSSSYNTVSLCLYRRMLYMNLAWRQSTVNAVEEHLQAAIDVIFLPFEPSTLPC
jgi:hypothetical protein